MSQAEHCDREQREKDERFTRQSEQALTDFPRRGVNGWVHG